jgi:ParB/RepB/Spo0J family partition protein
MRADSHYVEQFDSTPPTQIIRVLPIDRIKVDDEDQTPAHAPLVESIRRHGVLQPLLVQHARDGYRVIAGRKRLAAAAVAGLDTVPCLVHHVDDDEAEQLAGASNPEVNAADDSAHVRAAGVVAQRTASELSRSLARISSCSNLLESGELTQQVLSGIVRVEACRSWCLANALTVLSGAVSPRPARTSAKAIGRRVVERCEAERRVRSGVLETRASVRDATDVVADADLVVAILTGMVFAAFEGCEDAASEPVTLSIDVKAGNQGQGNLGNQGNQIVFGVSRRGSGSDLTNVATAFADVMRQAAEKLASHLGGRFVPADGHDTLAQIELPLATSN